MVSPEGAGEGDNRPRPSRTVFLVLGALAIAVGVIGLGALTSPEPALLTTPEATPNSSTSTTTANRPRAVDVTTFDVTQIATGLQFDWTLARSFESHLIHSLVEHEGWLYLFTHATPDWAEEQGGLSGWRSLDGAEWEPLGTVIGPEAQIGRVESTAQGLVATSASRTPNGLEVWTSDDGFVWDHRQLLSPEDTPNTLVFSSAIHGDEDRLVVAAVVEFDLRALLEQHLRETGTELGLPLDYGWDANETADGFEFTFYGPLGIVVYEATAAELGLSEDEARSAVAGFSEMGETMVFVLNTAGELVESSIEESAWVNDIAATPDGELLAFGFGNRGPTLWQSVDGISWVESELAISPRAGVRWGDRLIGPTDSSARVMVSEDGTSWEQTTLHERFPPPISWYVPQLDASDSGVAVVVEGWAQSTGTQPARPDPATIVGDDATLTLEFDSGHFALDDGEDIYTWNMYGAGLLQEGISIDLASGSIEFSHPETGEPLMVVAMDELQQAEQAYWLGRFDEEHFQALAFSTDGDVWSVQDSEDPFGPDRHITSVVVTTDRVVTVVQNMGSDLRSPTPDVGAEVWTAPIP